MSPWGRKAEQESGNTNELYEKADRMIGEIRATLPKLERVESCLNSATFGYLRDDINRMTAVIEKELNARANATRGRVRNEFGEPQQVIAEMGRFQAQLANIVARLKEIVQDLTLKNSGKVKKAMSDYSIQQREINRLAYIDIRPLQRQLKESCQQIEKLSHGGRWMHSSDLNSVALASATGEFGSGEINTTGEVKAWDPFDSDRRRANGNGHFNSYDMMMFRLENVVADHTLALADLKGDRNVPRWVLANKKARDREIQRAQDQWDGRSTQKPKNRGWFSR